MEARRQQNEILHMLRDNQLHQVKIYFKNEDKIKVCSHLQKTESVTIRPSLKEILKDTLQIKKGVTPDGRSEIKKNKE